MGAVGHGEVGEGWANLERTGWKPRQTQKEPTIQGKMGCHPFGGQYAAVVQVWGTCSHSNEYQGHGMGNGCSPYDRVDGCPHKQQSFVGWAPGQLPQAVTPTRQHMWGKEPDQDGPQLGKGHKDDPLRPHSPQGGKIWVEGREHTHGEPSLHPFLVSPGLSPAI